MSPEPPDSQSKYPGLPVRSIRTIGNKHYLVQNYRSNDTDAIISRGLRV